MNTESVSETRDPAMRKTTGFLGVGLLLLATGWAVQPRFKPATLKPAVERVLFKVFFIRMVFEW